jgi:hypothetical protein
MNTKQVFIILVATLFLGAISIGAQAGTTVKSSKSNSSDFVSPGTSDTGNPAPSNNSTTVNTSKSNTYKGKKDPPQPTPST